MTPYREHLINYREISSRAIRAANSQMFKAVGMGDMYVTAPNGETTTRYLLKNVLHAPAMSATLVSLGRLDDAGLHVSFWNSTCQI
ncbi:hypothetical protein BDY19DRAFT_874510, partial [Irpex rosettiformis]